MSEMEIASPEPALSDKTRLRSEGARNDRRGNSVIARGVSPKQSLFMYRNYKIFSHQDTKAQRNRE